jgi:hypothetical protein
MVPFPRRALSASLAVIAMLASVAAFPGRGIAGLNVWTPEGPDGGALRALAIDPSAPSTIYAGTYTGGLFKSTNAGGSWSLANFGLLGEFNNGTVLAVVVDPLTPSTVYVGSGGGVYKSTNGGASWSPAQNGMGNDTVAVLVIDPVTPTTLYATTLPDHGVWKTTDGAANWVQMNTGLGTGDFIVVLSIAVDPASPSTIYAGTDASGLRKSTNGGVSWSPTPITADVTSIAFDPSTVPSTVYTSSNGIRKSTDGGATWSAPTGSSGLIAIDPTTPSTLYVGGSGVQKSVDGGVTWTPVNTGLGADPVQALAIDPTASTVYAGTEAGVSATTNGGALWSARNLHLTATAIWALLVDAGSSTLYVGGVQGLIKTTDGGAVWNPADTGMSSSQYVDIMASDPLTPSTLYAAVSYDYNLNKSTDAAASWSNVSTALDGIRSIAIDPTTPTTLYAGTNSGGAKSIDGAATWTDASVGLAGRGIGIVIDPVVPTTLYVATDAGIYKSVDGAASWMPASVGIAPGVRMLGIAIAPASPSILYSSDWNGAVYKTSDGAATWSVVSFPTTAGTYALVVDPDDSSIVYAGTSGDGVFRSDDGGATWTMLAAGLGNATVTGLRLDPADSSVLHVSTWGGVHVIQIAATPTPTVTATPLVTATPTPTETPVVPDRFTCYVSGVTSGSVKFPGIPSLALEDALGATTVSVKKPKYLCAPTDDANQSPGAELHTEHLEGYPIKAPDTALPTGVTVVDQFQPGGLSIELRNRSHLLVPTVKDPTMPPALPGAFTTDHFACYRVRTSPGATATLPASFDLEDRFGTITVAVRKPSYLCKPVDKNGEDPEAPSHPGHLMCYQVKQIDQPKFAKRVGLFVRNQFGLGQLDAKKPADLCVPATTSP